MSHAGHEKVRVIHPKRGNVYRPAWADILEAAIPLLWNGEDSGFGKLREICSAPDNMEGPLHSLTHEIMQRLLIEGQCCYFSDFYRIKVNKQASLQEIQVACKAWMLDMIEEFRDEQNKRLSVQPSGEVLDEQN